MRMTIAGNADAVRQALQRLGESPLFRSLSQDLRSTAEIVLAEVLNNIAEHAYARAEGEIVLAITPHLRGLTCDITDTGAAMPGLRLPGGQFQPLGLTEDLPEGGFGWFLIRSLTEGLEYHRSNGVNRLSFSLTGEHSSR
jgi:serine/threonine-protein kinase RsbW